MSTTQHTGHYNLPTFGDNPNDRPSWRGDFTDAMTKIDNQMYANATNITTATAAANNAKTAADAAKESADTAAAAAEANKTDVAELDGYFSALGVTSAGTAQNLLNTINGKADASALSGKADANDVYTKTQSDGRYLALGGYSGTAASINATATAAKNDASAAKSAATTAQNTANDAATRVEELATARVDSKLDSHFIIHAHRGSYRFPENTMEGIMWSVRHGYVPEVDVQLTSDGVPVILHDTSTGRTMTGTAANVSSITYRDFMSREVKAKVHGGNTGRPVSMEQVLQAVGDSPVDFEIKSQTNATTDAMLELLRKYNATAIHELTSFSWDQCVRAARGGAKYVSFTWNWDTMPHSWTEMKNAGIFCGNPEVGKVTSEMVNAAHSAGVKINPWLINDPAAYKRVTNLGVDGITSDWPDYTSGQLERNFTPFSTGQNVFMRPTRFQAYGQQGYVDVSDADRAKSTYLAPDGLFQLGDADGQMAVELVEVGQVTLPVSIDLEGFMSRVQIGTAGDTRNVAVVAVKESTDIEPWEDDKKAGQVGIIAGVRRNGATFGGFYQDNKDTVAFDPTDTKTPAVGDNDSVAVHASIVLDKDHARIIWAYSNGQNGDIITGDNKNVTLPDEKYRLYLRVNRNFKSAWKIRVRPSDGYLYES